MCRTSFGHPQTRLLTWIVVVAAGLVGTVLRSAPAHADLTGTAVLQERPNIVLFLVDDARLDDLTATPSIQARIGGQGAVVRKFYAPFPLCCPARATLLTGEYPHNHGVLSNLAPTGGWAEFEDSSTLATWLTPTYRTGLIGKYFNQYKAPYTPPGWDEWMVPQGMYDYAGTRWWLDRGLGGAWSTVPGYQTDTIGSLASDFVLRNAPSDEPFFLYTSIVAPHAGVPADPDDPAGFPTPYVKPVYRDALAGSKVLTDPAFNEADVSDKSVRPRPLTSAEIAGLQETAAQRREALMSAEDAVERVLDTLAASGEADNTYVMFMSDNGYILGEHRIRGGKLAPYEVSNHVPFLVSGPGIVPGTVVDDVSAQVDFAPTVMSMAGLTAPAAVDGVDLLPRLTGTQPSLTRKGILLEATDTQATVDPLPWLYRGVVSQRFKYVERSTGKKELYDLRADPSELVNIANQTAYAAPQTRLARLLSAYRSCVGVTCR